MTQAPGATASSMEHSAANINDEAVVFSELHATRSNLAALLAASSDLKKNLAAVNGRLSVGLEKVAAASDALAPLQTQSIAAKALQSRINRAISPALSVLESFSLVESLQRRLLSLSDATGSDHRDKRPHLVRLLKYMDCVDRLNLAVVDVTTGCEPAVLRLQEAVEFLSRTKATDQLRIHRLRETLGAIKALYESEVDAMRYEGMIDDALLRVQDEYEAILQRIKHKRIGEAEVDNSEDEGMQEVQLGSELEVEVLGRMSETLASNDCLDICIDIYVKVRYQRAAKALMRLNPRYLKTFAAEEIDKMEWEALESAISLWIEHFKLAVKVVFVTEKQLCKQVLSGITDGGTIWPECFAKIADKIMAVFFRFGEGVARSSKEPQKLFKLLDMYDSLDRIRTEFFQVFDGESGIDICARFRELQKLLVHAASKVFWEFGLQIEGIQDGVPPPPDGSVPKIVRYAVNYLKCLAASGYAAAMGQVLRTEQMWKAGFLSRPEADESLLREAILNALDALQRNVEAKRGRYKDKVLPHVLAMNAYWYMYMRTKGSELATLVGEETMKKKYKTAAEKAAYSYQAQAWGLLVKLLEKNEEGEGREGSRAVARGKMDAFMKELEENLRRHQTSYCIQDADLREQIRQAVVRVVVPAYAGFLHSCSGVGVEGRSFLPPDSIRELLGRLLFNSRDGLTAEKERKPSGIEGARMKLGRREFRGGEMEEDERWVESGSGSFGRRDDDNAGGRFATRTDGIREGSFERKLEGRFVRRQERDEGEGGSFERWELLGLGGSGDQWSTFGRKLEENLGGGRDHESFERNNIEGENYPTNEEDGRGGSFGIRIQGHFGRRQEMDEGGGGGSFKRREGGRSGSNFARREDNIYGVGHDGSFGRKEQENFPSPTREDNGRSGESVGRNQGRFIRRQEIIRDEGREGESFERRKEFGGSREGSFGIGETNVGRDDSFARKKQGNNKKEEGEKRGESFAARNDEGRFGRKEERTGGRFRRREEKITGVGSFGQRAEIIESGRIQEEREKMDEIITRAANFGRNSQGRFLRRDVNA